MTIRDLLRRSSPVSCAILALAFALPATPARADQTIECRSRDYRQHSCPIADRQHGYVRLEQNLSDTACVRGRNWDYDEREIWVDDGCHGRFTVESRDSDSSGAATAAVIIGALAIGAAVAAHNDDDDHHKDKDYYGGGHSSYVPNWMTGEFSGYNSKYRKQVHLSIRDDGRATVKSSSGSKKGYVNSNHLYVGDHEFTIARVGDGFATTEIGDRSNHVYYSREGGSRHSVGYGNEYDVPQVIISRNGEGEVIFPSNNCVVYYNAKGSRKGKSNACSSGQGSKADDAMKRYRREQGY